MTKIYALLAWLRIDAAQADIAVAQFRELQRQIPLMYAVLTVNAIAVAYTHYAFAPVFMTVGIPGALTLICVVRITFWLKGRHRPVGADEAVRQLRRTIVLGSVLAIAYITWSLSLDRYGGAYEQGHVALFVAITVIGCIFCLMHLPQAALMVTALVTVPYLIYYFQQGNTVFIAIAINILLVTAAMIKVLANSYLGFTKLILSQTETERLSDENSRLAHTDMLTGLPNRRYFFAKLAAQIETSRQDGTRFAVGVLDLDRFKPINDTYGHVFGDRLLSDVGERLRDRASPGMIIARLGGDEFGFIVAAEGQQAEALGQDVCNIISQAYLVDEIRVSIGCSCGVAVYPDAGETVHELFDRSDYALYNSKTLCRGSATLYSTAHETRIRSERAIESALQMADFETEMEVHLQPIVDATGRAVAVEALARWTSPTLGSVRPDLFIAIAERAGLIHRLTLTLFRKALAQLERLPADIGLSFNLSAHDVTSRQTILALVALIRQTSVDPGRIILELTETALMRDFAVATESMRLLRSLGVKIALDDFGTGYSSLGYLHRLPIDKVKIDRSFVLELDHSSGRKIVASIMALCTTMQLAFVVEGVEDATQLGILQDLGCQLFQGYLFARPMPLDEMLTWIEANAPSVGVPSTLASSGSEMLLHA